MRLTSLNLLLTFLSVLAWAPDLRAQGSFTLSGQIYDANTHEALPGAALLIKGTSTGVNSDNRGSFSIEVKSGKIKISCEFVGYDSVDTTLTISANTTLNFMLRQNSQQLQEVRIRGNAEIHKEIATQNLTILQGADLDRTRGLSLGESLKSITGVTTFQTGPSISKPIIHGMYSNRILILNNGVRLEAQQWGSEHAPEIDPFIANKLEVIKGAAGIRYGSDAIGGVILVEPKELPNNPGMNGEVNIIGMTNSRLGAFSSMVQGAFDKKLKGLSYRLQGTYKVAGNTSTPNYLLENTGLREKDFSAALNYHHKNYGLDLYYSIFDTKLGIFTGAEVGSGNDLQQRIQEPRPLTPSYFSYHIDRPYQTVSHNTLKLKSFYNFDNGSKIQLQYADQTNTRSEYDFTPLNGRQTPELYLQIKSQTLDINYSHKQLGDFSGSFGLNGLTQGNVRKYEYLIPNFRNYGGGAYFIEKYSHKNLLLEAGLRYDYRWLRAYMLNDNTALIETPTTHYQASSSTLGALYNFTTQLKLGANFSSAFRVPTVNELYSNGVHQSLVSFEKGDPNLKTERANNVNVNLTYATSRVLIDLQGYYNNISNFIFSNPSNQITRTPRGQALVFNYTQANVFFKGIDLGITFKPADSIDINSKTSLIYAWNKTIHDYLIYTPANRFQNSVSYHLGSFAGLKNILISAEDIFVGKQTHVPAGQDYAPAPGGYNLVNTHLGFRISLRNNFADIDLSVNNLTNKTYRDYLDRFRYFTDEPGRNFALRLRLPFRI
ncbi:TonB-dependent receptor [Dyadobacter frigoris]|uniref:TonB-dependent receptor n=1 Tax=Dyadobacter frigoris TaxID=2576211 RepID=A0A4U6CWT1_9BACT|nr:TonB-dependent receptor [Dyadobacter frigoris]TKT88786.1 TonB-dependent receptor [Dyadobacter frigoris]GLU53983.1 membrane protein [Dyadobacter frigoris]